MFTLFILSMSELTGSNHVEWHYHKASRMVDEQWWKIGDDELSKLPAKNLARYDDSKFFF